MDSNIKNLFHVTFPPFFKNTSLSHISQHSMLLTVSLLRWKVGELHTLCKSWIIFSFCTNQVLLIPEILLFQSNNGLNKIEIYVSCNSRALWNFEVITNTPFFCLLLHFPYIGFHLLAVLLISRWLLWLWPSHLSSRQGEKRKGKEGYLPPKSVPFQNLFHKFHPAFLVISHWQNLVKWTYLALRKAIKYSLYL